MPGQTRAAGAALTLLLILTPHFSVAIGAGTGIGVGIDALIGRSRVLYRSPQRTGRLSIAPVASRNRHGVVVSVRFQRLLTTTRAIDRQRCSSRRLAI